MRRDDPATARAGGPRSAGEDRRGGDARQPAGMAEILVALACFVVLCGAALSRPAKLLEPDDYAYRASIVALSEGHIVLTARSTRTCAAACRAPREGRRRQRA